jgi:hypothetical protein
VLASGQVTDSIVAAELNKRALVQRLTACAVKDLLQRATSMSDQPTSVDSLPLRPL